MLARVHALNDFKSRGISLASKSSIYEFPALEIALECPGIRLANSPKTRRLKESLC